MNTAEIIEVFYREEPELRALLLHHSTQVRDKALQIAGALPDGGLKRSLDLEFVRDAAMLHDIGVLRCHAPGILCHGSEPYIAHGLIGAEMLREWGKNHGVVMEPYARVCARHTGSGLTAAEVLAEKLPIPPADYLPETAEEKLICLADKFFSKSGDMREKEISAVRRSMLKFGAAPAERFEKLCREFRLSSC